MNGYQYSDLDKQTPSFRLLNLRKGDGPEIECDIFNASLSDPDTHQYEALSYVWGTTGLVDCIDVDGRRLWITENLYIALQCLRSRDQDRILWIDAICINQSNLAERSHQVLLMGKIFGHAARVVFWLGKATVEAISLMRSLGALEAKVAALPQKGTTADMTIWKSLWSSLQPMHEPENDYFASQQQDGLNHLLKRPWFERVWILQEVYVAQSAIVCSGKWSVSATIFALSPWLLDVRPKLQVQSVLNLMSRRGGLNSQHGEERNSLINLLLDFQASKATDLRDMIFALVGMSSDPSHHELLRPDYEKPILEVVRNIVRYWLESTAVPISQIMHFLAGFGAVRTTYLVSLGRTETVREKVCVSVRSDVIYCDRNPSLLLIERNEESTTQEQYRYTFHAELDRIEMSSQEHQFDGKYYDDAIQFVPWSYSQQRAKFLIIKNEKESLLLAGRHGCKQVLQFIATGIGANGTDSFNEALIEGARFGDMTVVELALANGANVNVKENIDRSALHGASSNNHIEVAQLLINRGANVNIQDGYGEVPLYAASMNGYLKMVRLLIDSGADVKRTDSSDRIALLAAACTGQTEMVKLLVDSGADIDAHASYPGTAVSMASSYGHRQVVEFLIKRGAKINIKGHFGTALDAALRKGHNEIAQLLIKYGAKSEPRNGWL